MSGFGSGGFGGFGSNNNNNTTSSFGGFGTSNNTGGFGQQNNTTGFGSTSNNTGTGFGGFGSTSNTGFGAKPAFGSTATTSGGGLFGNTTATSSGGFGTGGFGTNTANTGGFGSNSTGNTLFGGNKTNNAFGSTGGGSLFGGNTTGTGFGSSLNNTNNNNTSTGIFGTRATGLGGPVPESQGTASPQFQVTQEKEPNGQATNNFQSITMQQPYQNYSFEELRVGDYNAGRRNANAGGQAGAFGASTGFGGFGGQNTQNQGGAFGSSTGGNLFGSTNNTSGGAFGANTTTSAGFGGSNFGAKPAGSLFGSTTNNAQPSGSLFGGSTGTAFGQNNNNNNAFGSTQNTGGAFGQANQQKSLFGATNTTGNAFGGNTSGGGFGSSTNLFGQQNQTQNQTQSNPFGSSQQNQSNPFSTSATNTGLGAFGNTTNNQQKPSLFGGNPSTNTGTTNLFGNNTQNAQQPPGSLFGASNNNTGGGLFGSTNNNNNASGGLFGQKPATGGSLFGNTQTNQQPTSNLFGQTQTQQNQAPNLFGASQQKPLGNTGASLFGNNNQQPANNSLFGTSANNQNQSSVFGSSLPAGQPNLLAQPQGMVASVNDPFPYGSASIFSGLPPVANLNPGPVATPIQAGQKQRKPAVLPQYKLNPAMSPRFVTPQRRGYGFSYSTYGTPTSAMSTPGGLGNSLLGSSIGRSLGKSFSTNNLRGNYDPEASGILAPGAFSVNSGRFSQQGSMKKLTIDRTLRTDLFGNSTLAALPSTERAEPKSSSSLRKRVSFDAGTTSNNTNHNDNGEGPSGSNGIVRTSDISAEGMSAENLSPTPTAEEQGYLRSSSRVNLFNGRVNGARRSQGSLNPEMSQIQGNELAIVREDDSLEPSEQVKSLENRDLSDPVPGNYWCSPHMDVLKRMTPAQLKNVQDFAVGRDGCGQCMFLRPVDLSKIDLNNLFGGIANFNIRSCTIYPNNANKPPAGGGLNVPARITLQNSWPRSRDKKQPLRETSGHRYDRHVKRLKNVVNAEFIEYDKYEGEWTFEVPHFTTYALDYDEDEMEIEVPGSSILSALDSASPDLTPRGKPSQAGSTPGLGQAETTHSSMVNDSPAQPSSEPEDTFEFKKRRLPGGFDDLSGSEDDAPEVEMIETGESFLGQRSAALPRATEDEPSEMQHDEMIEDRPLIVQNENQDDEITAPNMVGSFPEEVAPKSILKIGNRDGQTPRKEKLVLESDWTEQLQKTISPRKRDRQALRESQPLIFNGDMDRIANPVSKQPKFDNGEITTSIDLMKSLFGKEEMRRSMNGTGQQPEKQGFQWPYNKHINTEQPEMSQIEQDFHNSFKPSWGPGDVLVHTSADKTVPRPSVHLNQSMDLITNFASEHREIRLSKVAAAKDSNARGFEAQLARSKISIKDNVPSARPVRLPFLTLINSSTSSKEQQIWGLARILFDDYDDKFSEGIPHEEKASCLSQIRKDRFSAYWSQLCSEGAVEAAGQARTPEERAVAYLSMNAIVEASKALSDGKDFRLATLVAQIGGDKIMHEDIAEQITSWRQLNVLSEMNEAVRAIYEILAGNVCVSDSKKGPIEDRVTSFAFSERFKLDWRRAFAMRLWYSILDGEPVEAAVHKYLDDLAGRETARPVPSFVSQRFGFGVERREDILWGLLRLYAEQSTGLNESSVANVIAPQNLTNVPFNSRFSFELYHALAPVIPEATSTAAADQLATSFAAELESSSKWLWALFVLLHLSDSAQRQTAIQTLLSRQASSIDIDDASLLKTLFTDFKIPEAWIYEAKALYARSVEHDPLAQVRFLQKAGNWTEAHSVLCSIVAPRAIIERDYATLSNILAEFYQADELPHEWRAGGGVYDDYLALLEAEGHDEKQKLLGRLLRSLPELAGDSKKGNKRGGKKRGQLEKGSDNEGFLRNVASKEMGWVVGDMVLADRKNEREHALVLQLPLTREMRADRSRELGLEYYRKIMAAG